MKIICIGRNYIAHINELGNARESHPVVFIKPDTAVLKGSDFYIPEFSNAVDYEVELILKISKGGKYIQKENAYKHYEQIGIGIDFTARDLQNSLKERGLPWEIAKSFDGAAAIGNFFPKEEFDLTHLNFSLKKNAVLVQQGNTQQMIFSFDEIISYISQYFTLRIGDIIFTGTPAGVGKVEENDSLQAYIEDIKALDIRIF